MSDSPRRAAIERVRVIVPAFNEAGTITACLESIAKAASDVPVDVRVIVVADSCTDDTAPIARSMGAEVIEVTERNVGRTRAAGCAHALAGGADGLWLANTDADSAVPPGWLSRQLEYAAGGAHVVAGTVVVNDWQDWSPELQASYETFYLTAHREGRHHIHGCNLGFAAPDYQALGGFAPLHVGEDRTLLAAARAAGLTIVHPDDIPVRTSARRHARVIGGGFHTFLTLMADTV